jgi:glycosyltransferase involved in cell wall biosynthesis
MDQGRNIDAAEYFVHKVLPLLRDRGLSVTYYIVGQNPNSRVMALGEAADVVVTGTVDDVRPYLARAMIVVAPYLSGSGVKHKIPIAFSMGKAVVATSNACQGINVSTGNNVMLADSPESFASAIEILFHDGEKREAMGIAARHLISSRYSWDGILAQLVKDLDFLLE